MLKKVKNFEKNRLWKEDDLENGRWPRKRKKTWKRKMTLLTFWPTFVLITKLSIDLYFWLTSKMEDDLNNGRWPQKRKTTSNTYPLLKNMTRTSKNDPSPCPCHLKWPPSMSMLAKNDPPLCPFHQNWPPSISSPHSRWFKKCLPKSSAKSLRRPVIGMLLASKNVWKSDKSWEPGNSKI